MAGACEGASVEGDGTRDAYSRSIVRTDNLKRQALGATRALAGRIRWIFGRIFKSRRAQLEGFTQEVEGGAKFARGMAAERVRGAAQQVTRPVKRAADDAARRATQALGQARRQFHR